LSLFEKVEVMLALTCHVISHLFSPQFILAHVHMHASCFCMYSRS